MPRVETFTDRDLRGARFTRVDLSEAVLRAVMVEDAEIDAPWLSEGGRLVVNGVDVVPLVEAVLDERFPGRALRTAQDPDGLREAWHSVEAAWAAAIARADAMPPGTVDATVDGEWSFAQTLRHLVMATDTWLGRAVLAREAPYSPLGQPNAEYAQDGGDRSVFPFDEAGTVPPYADVLAVRAERQAMVRDYLAGVTAETLDEERAHPWAPDYPESVRACLQTILGEEWEHLRYALRDLDVLDAAASR